VGRRRPNVEFLVPVGAMVVPYDAQFLQDVERAVDGRRRRRRVDCAAPFDQLGARDVPIGLLEHVEEDAALERPAQAAGVQAIAHVGPCDLVSGCWLWALVHGERQFRSITGGRHGASIGGAWGHPTWPGRERA